MVGVLPYFCLSLILCNLAFSLLYHWFIDFNLLPSMMNVFPLFDTAVIRLFIPKSIASALFLLRFLWILSASYVYCISKNLAFAFGIILISLIFFSVNIGGIVISTVLWVFLNLFENGNTSLFPFILTNPIISVVYPSLGRYPGNLHALVEYSPLFAAFISPKNDLKDPSTSLSICCAIFELRSL